MARLPAFIRPMLASPGSPFDSADHLFEVKWDGIRAMAYRDRDGYRLVSRHGRPLTDQFPELAFLGRLSPGTVLDGELVVLQAGKPVLGLVQARHQVQSARKIRALAKTTPAVFMTFDLLFEGHRSLMTAPLAERREALRKVVASAGDYSVVYSEGVVGPGKAFFERVIGEGLEGVMAKRLAGCYRPGRRTAAWQKIKPRASASLAPVR
jgi:ATP-dependent DNA ligase